MPCESGPTMDQQIKAVADKFTRYLCDTMKIVELYPDAYKLIPNNIKIWWKQHKKEDAQREKAEKEREAAKSLLGELEEDPAVKAYLALKKKGL